MFQQISNWFGKFNLTNYQLALGLVVGMGLCPSVNLSSYLLNGSDDSNFIFLFPVSLLFSILTTRMCIRRWKSINVRIKEWKISIKNGEMMTPPPLLYNTAQRVFFFFNGLFFIGFLGGNISMHLNDGKIFAWVFSLSCIMVTFFDSLIDYLLLCTTKRPKKKKEKKHVNTHAYA